MLGRLAQMLDELGHFAPALANQADHENIRIGVFDQHVDQGGLTGTGRGKNTDALADTAGQ
ncbi:hypothetical protein D3C76_1491890 [compost metagenome]